MSQFVDVCRKEWSRLGVPEALANEMAGDLEADLAEARADGVSPEEVLGNGYFDAKSFAASWATARGVANRRPRIPQTIPLRSLALAVSALVCLAVGAIGLLLLAGPRMGSVSVAAVAMRHSIPRPVPGIFVNPHRLFFAGPGGGAVHPLGLVLLVAGLVGLGVTFVLWRPWSTRRNRAGFDRNVGMPSYL